MRTIAAMLSLISCLFLTACQTKYEQNQEGFRKLSADLEDRFGKDTWYTSISLSKAGDENEGYIVAVDKADDPSSLRQERWIKSGGMWEQAANVTLEIKGGKPSDFMFRLHKEVDLAELGRLIEVSRKKLVAERGLEEPMLKLAIVSTNNTILSKEDKINYTIIWQSPEDENTYSFTYDLHGNLKNDSL